MNHEIFLRCHTRVLNANPAQKQGYRKSPPMPKHVLVLDTETTTDACQALNFSVYQFCEADSHGNYICREEGLLHADDLDTQQLEVLRQYLHVEHGSTAENRHRKLKLYSRSEFVEKVMYTAIQAGPELVALNLRFNFSRLRVGYGVAGGGGREGWGLVFFGYGHPKPGKWWPNRFR